MSRIFRMIAVGLAAGLVVFAGAGCGSASPSISGATPSEAAARLMFHDGDQFSWRQTLFGIGSLLPGSPSNGSHRATVTHFDPGRSAGLAWSTETDQETSSSRAARMAFLDRLKSHPPAWNEAPPSPPPIVLESVTSSGTLDNVNLADAHLLSVPGSWPPGSMDLRNQRSGLWLSQTVFDDLAHGRQTDLSFDATDQAAASLLKNIQDAQQALAALRHQAVGQSTSTDPALTSGDKDRIDWMVKINGVDTKVAAIRARNWFGEYVVLDNQKNPFILKLTVNPITTGAAGAAGGGLDVNGLLGYEVTDVTSASFPR